jgi:membrane protease YdiL (CAAX protease family)
MQRTAWTWIGIALALVGPGAVAGLSQPANGPLTLWASAPWLAIFCMLLVGVASVALIGERLSLDQIGFGGTSWLSGPTAILLVLFVVFILGPTMYAALAQFAVGSFDAGRRTFEGLPRWYLTLTIVVVAAGEEWLYRGYAIERLEALTGNAYAAGGISLLMFGMVHLPLWGIGVALSTLVSGAIFTALYIWRRDIVALMTAHVLIDLYGLAIVPIGGHASS